MGIIMITLCGLLLLHSSAQGCNKRKTHNTLAVGSNIKKRHFSPTFDKEVAAFQRDNSVINIELTPTDQPMIHTLRSIKIFDSMKIVQFLVPDVKTSVKQRHDFVFDHDFLLTFVKLYEDAEIPLKNKISVYGSYRYLGQADFVRDYFYALSPIAETSLYFVIIKQQFKHVRFGVFMRYN